MTYFEEFMRLMHGVNYYKHQRNVYYRHTLISSPCNSRKTEDDLIAVRAIDILKAEANLDDRKIVADLSNFLSPLPRRRERAVLTEEREISPRIATLSRLAVSSWRNRRDYRLLNKDNGVDIEAAVKRQTASKECINSSHDV